MSRWNWLLAGLAVGVATGIGLAVWDIIRSERAFAREVTGE